MAEQPGTQHTAAMTEPAAASAERAAVATQRSATTERTAGAAPPAGAQRSLSTGRGATTIADSVVTKVAGIAAREVPGVHQLGGSTTRALGSVTQRVGIGDSRTQGVNVEVGERQAAVDLTVVIEYGESIPHVAQQLRDHIIKRIEGLVGLEVTEVNIAVDDLHFPGEDVEEPEVTRVS